MELQIRHFAGDWAHWSSWSACSHSCGGGFHFRDRTCTDPAPLYRGRHCKGPGSDVAHCFHGPCPDREDTGVRLNGSSGLLYSPFHKPQSYLSLHLLLHPLLPNGTIVYRSRVCKMENCPHIVKVSLVHGRPYVVVVNRGSKLIIKSNTTLQVREWHTIYVYLSQYHGFLRINNGAHLHGEYRPKPSVQVNYDSEMTLGAKTDDGFVGVIADANVNFQMLSLRRISGWNGTGMPEDEWLTQSVHVDPLTKYPKFKKDTFIKLFISDIKTLSIQMSILPLQLDGLVLFNKGRLPGSFVYLIIHKGVFQFCFNCGQLSVCENIQDVEAMRWYHVSIFVSGVMSNIRINLGKAVQLTSPGLPYHTGSQLFIGGGERHDWVIFTAITGTDRGFSGVVYEVTINRQHYTLWTQPLVDNRGFVNSEGATSTEKIMEIIERSYSKVVLRCDFSRYAHPGSDVYVEWFNVDKKIKSSPHQKITPRLPGDSYIGALTLSAKHHDSELYVCMVRHNGRLTNHIAFVLTRDNTDLVYGTAASIEKTEAKVFFIVMAIFALLTLIFLIYKVYQSTKKDGIARSSNKDKFETEFRQPPGINDSYKWPITPSLQSITSHPSMHNTSEAVSHQPSTISNGPRRSSVILGGTQSAREDIYGEAIPRRSSVQLHGVQSAREDIDGEEIPRRSSVQLYGVQSDREDIDGEEIPRRSSVQLHGVQSAREDIDGEKIPRRSSVQLYGVQSARDNTINDEIHRGSSVQLHGVQSAREDIDGEEITRRSSVQLHGVQSAREDIDSEKIPRRSSVQLYGVQSARDNTINDEIPRGSSVQLHGVQSAREDIDGEKIPRRSSVQLHGVQSARDNTINDEILRRTSVKLRGTQSARKDIDDEILSDVQPPQPQISWTHRSTHQIAKESFRSRASILENQLSCSLPPAGSPSPPKSPLVRTSSSHQQPNLAITVSAKRSLTGSIDPQYTLPTLLDETSSSSDQSSESDTGTD